MTEYDGQEFSSESLESLGDLAKSEFYSCTLTEIDGARLSNPSALRFFDCRFVRCNLSNLNLMNFVFRDCVFEGCKLVGLDWTKCSTLSAPAFRECKLDFSNFRGLDLRSLECRDVSARDVDFSGAELFKADFSSSLLTGALFDRSDLREADFRGAKEYSFDPSKAKIKGARMSFPEALALLQVLGVRIET